MKKTISCGTESVEVSEALSERGAFAELIGNHKPDFFLFRKALFRNCK